MNAIHMIIFGLSCLCLGFGIGWVYGRISGGRGTTADQAKTDIMNSISEPLPATDEPEVTQKPSDEVMTIEEAAALFNTLGYGSKYYDMRLCDPGAAHPRTAPLITYDGQGETQTPDFIMQGLVKGHIKFPDLGDLPPIAY